MAAIAIGESVPIRVGSVFVRALEGRSIHVLFMLGEALLRAGIIMDAAGAAAECCVVVPINKAPFHAVAVLEGFVDIAAVHVHHRGVVVKTVAAPLAAGKSKAAITTPIVDAAVVSDVPSPVTFMKEETTAFPTPIAGSPEQARSGSRHPRAGNPIVAGLILIEGPVAGGPHEAWFRAGGLLVDRQRRWAEIGGDRNLSA